MQGFNFYIFFIILHKVILLSIVAQRDHYSKPPPFGK